MSIYGFIIGIAFVLGFELFSKKNNIIPKRLENIFFILLFIVSIIGARTYSVLSNLDYYSHYPIQIINTRAGGLGIFGGLIFGIIFVFVFSKINHLSFIKITDLLVPFVALGQSLGRWGNYFNTELFGIPTKINFGQYIPEKLRPLQFQNFSYFHPVWLYESILDLILFIILLKLKKNQMSYYLIFYGIIRFLLEFIRWDSWSIGILKVSQILSLVSIVIGLIIIKTKKDPSF